MKWRSSGEDWMARSHMPHVHAVHMPHPAHWLGEHPMVLALLLAGIFTLLIIGMVAVFNPEVRSDMLRQFDYQALYPYGSAY